MMGTYSRVQPIIIITAKVTIRMETAVVCAYVYACVCMPVYQRAMCVSVCVQPILMGPFVAGPVLVLCPSDWILSQQSP